MLIEFSDFNLKILILLIFPIFKTVQDYSKKAYVVEDNYLRHSDILQVIYSVLFRY